MKYTVSQRKYLDECWIQISVTRGITLALPVPQAAPLLAGAMAAVGTSHHSLLSACWQLLPYFFYCYLWPTQLQDPQYSFHGVLQCLLIQDKTCPCEERRPLWKFMHQNNIYQNSILARYSVNLSLIVPSFSVRDCFFFLLSLYLSSWTMLGALRQQTY